MSARREKNRRTRRRVLVIFSVGALILTLGPPAASGQSGPTTGERKEKQREAIKKPSARPKRSAQTPQKQAGLSAETIAGVLSAYLVLWLILFGYLFRLRGEQARLARRAEALQRQLEKAGLGGEKQGAAEGPRSHDETESESERGEKR
jgi:hypothetical protein